VVSGGNNDISRYGDILERSLVHEGLKHYFLVTFPQEPGALRRFLDSVLGPDDDITLFEYVKKSNRETGPALVGIELARAGGLAGVVGAWMLGRQLLMTRDGGFKRRVRARMAHTGETYATARAHLDRGPAARSGGRVLHVTNGDSVVRTLQEAGVDGPILPWR